MKLLLLAAALNGVVALTGFLSYFCDRMFSIEHMNRFSGYARTMPLIAQGGIWSDLILINPLLTVLIERYHSCWSYQQWLVSCAISYFASLVMHEVYKMNPCPDCLAWNSRLTMAGVVHVWYMTFAFTVIGLFYFATPHPDPVFLRFTSLILCFHMLAGTNVFLNIINPRWWNKTVLEDTPGLSACFIVWALIMWRWFALSN